uniref:Leucine-rich repeat-containing N-terminal plant-type domain-containing protein n=1 Tax=Oryza rufipogon TaxID=4529 RepID=A0A0E0PJS0_ORYRU
MRSSGISVIVVVRHLAWLVLILCSWPRVAAAQAQQAPKTDPVEAVALNTILGRWGKKASWEWNISGELCSGFASTEIDWDYYPTINPFIKCDCSFSNNTLCHITKLYVCFHQLCNMYLDAVPEKYKQKNMSDYRYVCFHQLCNMRVYKLGVVGQIPAELQNLTHLESGRDTTSSIDDNSLLRLSAQRMVGAKGIIAMIYCRVRCSGRSIGAVDDIVDVAVGAD